MILPVHLLFILLKNMHFDNNITLLKYTYKRVRIEQMQPKLSLQSVPCRYLTPFEKIILIE